MSSDMTKKTSMYNQNYKSKGDFKPVSTAKNSMASARLYNNLTDCIRKSQKTAKGRELKQLYRGYSAALISQVPYTVLMLSSFEYLDQEMLN